MIVGNEIKRLARSILAQITPVTGTRATGAVTVTAETADVELPPNAYLVPIVHGKSGAKALDHHNPFKVTPNPATVDPVGQGGDWTITSAGVAGVGVTSNVGGVRHNLAGGTELVFDPPIAGLVPKVTLDAAMTDGAEGPKGSLLRAVFFEDLETNKVATDFMDGRIPNHPAVMIVWARSDPAEGRTIGLRQGGTRVGRGKRILHEMYGFYIVTSRLAADPLRRSEGLQLLEDCAALLTDSKCNRDNEALVSLGSGLEVNERTRFTRGPGAYVYAMTLRASRTLRHVDERTFNPWNLTRYRDFLEQEGILGEIDLVDVSFAMP